MQTAALTWEKRAVQFCLAVSGCINCSTHSPGFCPLSETPVVCVRSRDSPDLPRNQTNFPMHTPGYGLFPKLFHFRSGKRHSSSSVLQAHTSSSQLLKKTCGAADRCLSFLTIVPLREEYMSSSCDCPRS